MHRSRFCSCANGLAVSVLLLGLLGLGTAQQSVYVPGQIDDTPGASLQPLGVGPDGLTSYLIEGATLAENAGTAVLTQMSAAGAVVYSCNIGADLQATCSVSQAYDGVTYGYTEPVTYFGSTIGAAATAGVPTTPPAAAAATTTAQTAVNSGAGISSIAPLASSSSSSSSMTTTTRATSTPKAAQANAQKPLSSNIFEPPSSGASPSASTSIRTLTTVLLVSTVMLAVAFSS